MLTSPLFIQYYSKHIIALFIIITAVIGLDVAVRDANLLSYDNSGAVKGESTVNLDSTYAKNSATDQILTYQQKVKNIIQFYLNQRASYSTGHQDWLFLINNGKNQLMEQSVPEAYSDLHLKLVTTLDLEERAVAVGGQDEDLAEVNQRWREILQQYYWLQ